MRKRFVRLFVEKFSLYISTFSKNARRSVDRKYYTYSLSYNDIPFYIGKGTGERLYSHEKAVINGRIPNNNRHLFNKIKNIIESGNNITYTKLLITNNEQDAFDYETYMIKKIGIDNLCNICEIGNRGGYLGEEVNKRRSKSLTGKKKTKQHRKNLSIALSGRTLSKEHHNNIVDSRRNNGKEWTPQSMKDKLSKKFRGSGNPRYTIYTIENPTGDIFTFNSRTELKEYSKSENVGKKHMDKVNILTVADYGYHRGYKLIKKEKPNIGSI